MDGEKRTEHTLDYLVGQITAQEVFILKLMSIMIQRKLISQDELRLFIGDMPTINIPGMTVNTIAGYDRAIRHMQELVQRD